MGGARHPLNLEFNFLIVQTDAENMDKGQIYSPIYMYSVYAYFIVDAVKTVCFIDPLRSTRATRSTTHEKRPRAQVVMACS